MSDNTDVDARLFRQLHGRWPDGYTPPTANGDESAHPPHPAETVSPVPARIDDGIPIATALEACLTKFREWLWLSDADVVLTVLGAVAANLIAGDPVWLLLVGSPSSGKTEIIAPLTRLPYVHSTAALTEAALLSGTPAKQRAPDAKGGLLRNLGEFGIVLAKDFTSVLAMNPDTRARLLAALREIYDGDWTRMFGSDGGRQLYWKGKAGFIGAVTPTLDRHHAVIGAVGDRFVLRRMHEENRPQQSKRRLANRGREREMRAQLSEAVADVLGRVPYNAAPRPLTDDEIDRLVDLSVFVATARTAVERDGYRREVELKPEPEAPGRLSGALAALFTGVEAVGGSTEDAWRVVDHVAWDCMPAMRRSVLDHVRGHGGASISDVAEATGTPRNTITRCLEDLALLDLLDAYKDGVADNALWRYRLSVEASEGWPASSPEMSAPHGEHT